MSNAPIQETLRKAKGSEVLPTVFLGMMDAEKACLAGADRINALSASHAALVEAGDRSLAVMMQTLKEFADCAGPDFWDELCEASGDIRAALAQAKDVTE